MEVVLESTVIYVALLHIEASFRLIHLLVQSVHRQDRRAGFSRPMASAEKADSVLFQWGTTAKPTRGRPNIAFARGNLSPTC
jgi:hypothetical protein